MKKNISLSLILPRFTQKLVPKMEFKIKLMNQTQQNDEKHKFESNFDLFDSNLGLQNVFVSFTSTSSCVLSEAKTQWILKEN